MGNSIMLNQSPKLNVESKGSNLMLILTVLTISTSVGASLNDLEVAAHRTAICVLNFWQEPTASRSQEVVTSAHEK